MAKHITCANCGFVNAPGARFCGNCAETLHRPAPEPSQASHATYCPYCEHPNPPGAPYCGNCRRALRAASEAAQPAWVSCPNCGSPNPAGATFCGECGYAMSSAGLPPDYEQTEEQRGLGRSLLPLVIVSALVLVGAIVAFFVLSRPDTPLPGASGGIAEAEEPAAGVGREATDTPPAVETAPPTDPPPTATSPPTPVETPTEPPTLTPFPSPTRAAPTATATTNPTPTPDRGPEALVLGTTSRGTAIEAVRFGNGPRTVIFIGGLAAGFAPSTVALAEAAVNHFSRNPALIPDSLTVYIVLSASPDSPVAPGNYSGRLNANGVDLNRNWDCNWAADTRWQGEVKRGSGGTAAFSEAENRALRDLIEAEGAVAVVFWQARAEGGLASPGGCGDRVEVSAALAGIYGLTAGYRVENFEDLTRQTLNGDASNYLDSIGVPAVSVLLPNYSSSIDWQNNLNGIMAVLDAYAD